MEINCNLRLPDFSSGYEMFICFSNTIVKKETGLQYNRLKLLNIKQKQKEFLPSDAFSNFSGLDILRKRTKRSGIGIKIKE